MARPLQSRKRRSSRPTVRQSQRPKRPVNPMGNGLIAKNWNKKETLTQNYRRLGLVSRLKAPAGGIERAVHDKSSSRLARGLPARNDVTDATTGSSDIFAIAPVAKSIVKEVRVARDADGRIVLPSARRSNPLGDLLNELDDNDDDDDEDSDSGPAEGKESGDGEGREKGINGSTGHGAATRNRRVRQGQPERGGSDDDDDDGPRPYVVRELERASMQAAPPRRKHQSEAEAEWLGRLVAKHGDDMAAMARDRRLNPMQQTANDLAKRIRRLAQAT